MPRMSKLIEISRYQKLPQTTSSNAIIFSPTSSNRIAPYP